jgi:benzoyl-CoA-dihydrodiol lyase
VVDFDTHPSVYRHWRLEVDGPQAVLTLDVDERGGLEDGYELKLNSYDLGVDIELHDAVQRLRFEHPQVRAVVLTSGAGRVFSAGANIRMLAQSPHHWKVNFCKFTNETRSAIEDATTHSGQTWIAAVNGSAAGGGYELALACAEILLVDDGSSTVALPEVPLLGVLPGTGGLTRLVDKRYVRRDVADVFATRPEGVRGQTAVEWGLVDAVAPPRRFAEAVQARVAAAIEAAGPCHGVVGIELPPLDRRTGPDVIDYPNVHCALDRSNRAAVIVVSGPDTVPSDVEALHAEGAAAWPLAVARELDDLALRLRFNEPELGTWVLKTAGDPAAVVGYDALLAGAQAQPGAGDRPDGGGWLAGEIRQSLCRAFTRLDHSARSLVAVLEPGSCFAGALAELALLADRSYLLDGLREEDEERGLAPATLTLTEANFGAYPMANRLTRLQSRFWGRADALDVARGHAGTPLVAKDAADAGLVTFVPDELDWDDEVRLAIEERASFNPDALTGMEANLRFAGPETVETKIFGRLTAWQNWVFGRPNAAGPDGALRRYGTGQRPDYDRKRV